MSVMSRVFVSSGVAESAAADLRPILLRNPNNVWCRAESARDELYDLFSDAVSAEHVNALVLKSAPYVFPAWVQVAAWVPRNDRDCAERRWVKVSIDPKPYCRHEIEYTVEYSAGTGGKRRNRVIPFGAEMARQFVRYTVARGGLPKPRRFRSHPLELWRPSNAMKVVRLDLLKALAMTLTILGGIALLGGVIDLERLVIGLVVAIVAVFLWVYIARLPHVVRTQGKPAGEPRRLLRLDSWQTVIFGAGSRVADLRARFAEILKTKPIDNFAQATEKVWYWGLDGKEEREQIVLTAGRGIVFCQLYRYGSDLYVGWDGHVNYGQWAEKVIATGIDRKLGLPASISAVEPGTQAISEYDIIDLNCLMEWTHAQLTTLIKQLMQESKIDQEIDFKILRGERQKLTEEGAGPDAKKEGKKKLRNAFKRTG